MLTELLMSNLSHLAKVYHEQRLRHRHLPKERANYATEMIAGSTFAVVGGCVKQHRVRVSRVAFCIWRVRGREITREPRSCGVATTDVSARLNGKWRFTCTQR